MQLRQRAKYLCEYCHTSEQWQYVPFTVDHIIPLSLGGNDSLENLALACFHCNRRKTHRVTIALPETSEEIPLFNLRQDNWSEHFIRSADGLLIVGVTQVGRITVTALALNRERVIGIRAANKQIGRHPPQDDPIQKN
ncbi:HNH endonuclease [Chroococcidiopsis sp.]|uniref:HNH endonuclease n=1 Tax=Chroococcidiopsis sp. TaxID=3088168 RepID=UPI003F2A5D5E